MQLEICFKSQQPQAKPVVCHDVGNRSMRFRFVRQASAGATSPVYLGVSPRSFGALRNFRLSLRPVLPWTQNIHVPKNVALRGFLWVTQTSLPLRQFALMAWDAEF